MRCKHDPIAKKVYTDNDEFIKQLNCPYKMNWNDLTISRSTSRECSNCNKMVMKVFQLKLFSFCKKSGLLKIILSLVMCMFCFFNLSAQKESNVKLKIETGFLWDWHEGNLFLSGIFLHLEPKLETTKNTVIGLRIGAALNTQAIKNSNPTQIFIDKNFTFGNAALSLIPTFDYYFIKSKFRPYLGTGIGYYFLTTNKDFFVRGNSMDAVEVSVNNQMGFLFRGGLGLHKFKVGRFDLSKFIVGLEFNYILKAAIEMPNGQIAGTINYSNIALSIGYIIGKRKSSK